MKIVLASPLYPPDIANPAPYIKELAERLKKRYKVTLVVYAHIPENVENVHIVSIDKRYPRIVRLLLYSMALGWKAFFSDLLYVQNGPSVELTALIASYLTRCPFILRVGDERALERSKTNRFYKKIHELVCKRASRIISETPHTRPEILPFDPLPQAAFQEYETSWKEHVDLLEQLFSRYARGK